MYLLGSVVLDEINVNVAQVDVRVLGPKENIFETLKNVKNFTDVVAANDEDEITEADQPRAEGRGDEDQFTFDNEEYGNKINDGRLLEASDDVPDYEVNDCGNKAYDNMKIEVEKSKKCSDFEINIGIVKMEDKSSSKLTCMEDHNYCRVTGSGLYQASPRLICSECGKSYPNEKSLKNHEYYKHTEREYKYQCSYCEKKFTMKLTKKKHEKKHLPKNYTCSFCGKMLRSKQMMEQHEKRIHSK